ncbi:MAG TPA: DMT family transporter [Burkholderiales bacterium]|nr:DMT family transporter [Burkholderiales bacterium]
MKPIAALLLLAVIWGYNWVVMKSALPHVGPLHFAAMRTFFAAVLMFFMLAVLKRPMKPAHLVDVSVIGLLQTSGFTGLVVLALVTGGAGKVAVLCYTMPFWVMMLAWPLLGERIRGLQWVVVLLSCSGLLLILEPWHLEGSALSDMLAVAGGLCWALSVIMAKKLHKKAPEMDLLSFTSWQMMIGSIPLVLLSLFVREKAAVWDHYLMGAVFYNVVAANVVAWLLWLYALRNLAAGTASMVSLLAQVIGVLSAWLELGEVPSLPEASGMLLIGLSLAMIAFLGMKKHESPDPAIAQE